MLTKSVFLTGATGFIGSNLIEFFNVEYTIINFQRDLPILINQTIVIHLAGNAHDNKKNIKSRRILSKQYRFNKKSF